MGYENCGTRTKLEQLDYRELLQLGIRHLVKRMKGNAKQSVKDHIATVLISKSLPQNVNLKGELEHINTYNINLSEYNITDDYIKQYARDLLNKRGVSPIRSPESVKQ